MSVRLLDGTYDGDRHVVVLVDSTRNRAFGPLFESADDAESFLAWFESGEAAQAAHALGIESVGSTDDPRGYKPGDLDKLYQDWQQKKEDGLLPA